MTVHDLVVSDATAPLAAGPGCVQVDAHTASCTQPLNCTPGFSYPDMTCWFLADLNDREDVLDADPSLPVTADGGPGDDRLLGGDHSDYLSGGPGADFMQGRGGYDAVDYDESGRSGGVEVRIDDAPGDGAPGEGDDVRAEVILATPEDDTLVGNDVDNVIYGRGGADRIACRGGFDTVYTERVELTRPSCETAVIDGNSARLTPEINYGGLSVRDRAVTVPVRPYTATDNWPINGRVRLSTGGGRRLGGVAVQAYPVVERTYVRIPLTRGARRLLERRSEWTVRVTGSVPDRSVIRVLAQLET